MGIHERKQREKARRAKEIIEAAEIVFFSKGYEQATMDDIAQEAELSKGTLYLYFKTKEELYTTISKKGMQLLKEKFLLASESVKLGIDKVMAICQAYFEFSQQHRNYFNALNFYAYKEINLHYKNDPAIHEEGDALHLLIDILQLGIQDGSIYPKIDATKQAIILWGQAMGVIQVLTVKGDYFSSIYNTNTLAIVEDFMQFVRRSLQV